jgi:pyruvate/2-oxoacid:ferredoxin oxidoreductase alpha subunit
VLFGEPGDAPKIVLAPSTIEECFHCMITARRLAETFRTVVVVLSDANLATGVQPFRRPVPQESWLASAPDLRSVATVRDRTTGMNVPAFRAGLFRGSRTACTRPQDWRMTSAARWRTRRA